LYSIGKLDNFLDGAPSPSSIEAKKAKLALLTDEQLVDRVIALEAEVFRSPTPAVLALLWTAQGDRD